MTNGANPRSGQAQLRHLGRRPRIALYSHDTMGLGHVRRNLLIAQTLATSELRPDLMLLTGSPVSASFTLPPGADVVTLPTLYKSQDGTYHSRHWSMSFSELIAVRSRMIEAAVTAFRPDLLIVDNVPRGAGRELDPVLESLRHARDTRVVLGMRDVLDDPDTIKREWTRAANEQAIRSYYDAVWVYGDPTVYHPAREYGFAHDIAARMRFTGYLDQRQRLTFASNGEPHPLDQLGLPPGDLVLCLVGGGQDGAKLAEAFAEATLPPGINGVTLTGPHMPAETRQRLQAQAAGDPRRRVLEFLPEPGLLWERASRVITMGGYNSVSDALSYGKPTLVVPRIEPRREQIIRAERLRDLRQIDMLHPDAVSATALTAWLSRPAIVPALARAIDLNGLDRLPRMVESLISAPAMVSHNGSRNLEALRAAV